jgi:hypothetical protein
MTQVINSTPCRSSHRKCNRELPSCSTCLKRGIECCYNPPKKRGRQSPTNTQPMKQPKIEANSTASSTSMVTRSKRSRSSQHYDQESDEELSGIEQVIASYFSRYQPDQTNTFDFRVNKILWYAIRGVALYHAPRGLSEQNAHIASDYFAHLSGRLQRLSSLNFSDTSDLLEMANRFSISELKQAAEYMFQVAKKTLMEPGMYPHITINAKLAEAAIHMAGYLNSKNDPMRRAEARLLLSGAALFVESAYGAAEIDMSQYPGNTETEKLQYLHKAAETIKAGVNISKFVMLLNNCYLSKNFTSREQLENSLQYSIQAIENNMLPLGDQQNNVLVTFKTMLQFLREETGITRLVKFLSLCKTMRSEINWANRPTVSVTWKTRLLTYEFWAINSEASACGYDPQVIQITSEMKLDCANQFAKVALENLVVFLIFGNAVGPIFIEICKTHMEHFKSIGADSQLTQAPLAHILAFLQTDKFVVDSLYERYDNQDMKEISKQLANCIENASDRLQLIKHYQYTSSNPQSDLPVNTAPISPFIQLLPRQFQKPLQELATGGTSSSSDNVLSAPRISDDLLFPEFLTNDDDVFSL